MKKWLVVAGIGVLALLVSGGLVGMVLAAGPTDGKSGIQQTFISKLAKVLGIQEDQLKKGITQAQNEMVDDALKAGKLNQDQANKMKDRIGKGGNWGAPSMRPPKGRQNMHPPMGPNGKPNTPSMPGANGRQFMMPGMQNFMKTATDFLGMKPADLMAEMRQGKTLAQIAKDHGKSVVDLKNKLVTDAQTKIDEAATKGTITKDKAAELKKTLGDQADKFLNSSMQDKWHMMPKKPAPSAGKS
ncbi:MAG: hypothetical protein Q7O66_15165 [Dehalococcoidia bacterium]|nr:hypothetical protein [Dehalococcoidia bacterium]